jgi:multimeric flavodoxin WrbA
VIGLDCGPRKGWNTATLIGSALEGAGEAGAETKIIRLYDLDYKGCRSCFACKRKGHYMEGVCAQKDGLSPVLEELKGAAGLVIGSPIYLGDVTACMRAFFERYVFSNLNYDVDHPSVLDKGPSVLVIYAMGIPERMMGGLGYDTIFRLHAGFLERLNGAFVEQMASCDTLQFDDYSKYHAPMFDEGHKKAFRESSFPGDIAKAREVGLRLGAA